MDTVLLDLVPDTGVTFTATVVIAGIGIVLSMLILLIIVFRLFSKIVSGAESKKRNKKSKENSNMNITEQKVQMPVFSAPAAPVVEAGISGEVVAAIAAAVAMNEGSAAVVKSIRKVNVVDVGSRNPWAMAAIMENTKPF